LRGRQAGAGAVLRQADATGSVPAQLAREKGHRFLAHYLEEYRGRADGSKWCAHARLIWRALLCGCQRTWLCLLTASVGFVGG
jgi:palmitoyltransferase